LAVAWLYSKIKQRREEVSVRKEISVSECRKMTKRLKVMEPGFVDRLLLRGRGI
jgi:hypothetical protein